MKVWFTKNSDGWVVEFTQMSDKEMEDFLRCLEISGLIIWNVGDVCARAISSIHTKQTNKQTKKQS